MFGNMTRSKISLVAAGAILAGTQIGLASTLTFSMFDGSIPSASQVNITLNGSSITPGDGFVIYGFTSYVGGAASPAAATDSAPTGFTQFTIQTTSNDFAGGNPTNYNGPNISLVYEGSTTIPDADQTFGISLLSAAEIQNSAETAAAATIAEDMDPLTSSTEPPPKSLANDPIGVGSIALAPVPRASLGGLSLFGVVQLRRILRRRRLANS